MVHRVSFSCTDLSLKMQVVTCEKKVCWVFVLHIKFLLGGLSNTKAPNDHEVPFNPFFLHFFPFCIMKAEVSGIVF